MPNSNKFSLAESIALLTRTPATLNALLRGLPDMWTHSNEGKDTWSAFDIVGHLIVADRTDWMPRVRTILEHGEARPFDPFDRFAQTKESKGKSLEQLLDDFALVRNESLAALQALNLQSADLGGAEHIPRWEQSRYLNFWQRGLYTILRICINYRA